ncbi:MAG: HAD family phosphatase [Clostridia bacterium]|nr:HAD family phosphatase [Clostridia bacterium]
MNEGIRFDLEYETMPWHKVDAVVFDIGNILIRFAPDDFIEQLFPGDEKMQRDMLDRVYHGPQWKEFDRGTMTYEEACAQMTAQYGGRYEDYMHALTGWIELKTPLEEGWRAAKRCKRAGKKLYLLSNYPRQGYERLREKFADRFEIFDGGVISCYVHLLKPEEEMYSTLIDACSLDPARTLFIDDMPDNVHGAMKKGIHGFHMHETGMMDRFFL